MFSSVTDMLKSKIQKKHSQNLVNRSVIHDHPRQRFHENQHNAPQKNIWAHPALRVMIDGRGNDGKTKTSQERPAWRI